MSITNALIHHIIFFLLFIPIFLLFSTLIGNLCAFFFFIILYSQESLPIPGKNELFYSFAFAGELNYLFAAGSYGFDLCCRSSSFLLIL